MAVAAKNKEPASDSFMAPDKMKPLLALSKREPVQAAIGLTADGEGVILLDKKLKSKKVLALLKATAAKQKIQLQPSTLRFGKAEVDTDYDPGMVRFFVNKDPPGNMRVKLVEVVKRIPYQKVELNVDTSFENESEEDEAQAPEAPQESVQSAPPPEAPTMDVGMLAHTLATLAKRVGEVADQAVKGTLLQLANSANGALKAADLPGASGFIDQLREALERASQGPAPDGGALAKELATLLQQVAALPNADTRKAQLVKLAQDARDQLKSNDLTGAAKNITQVRDALGAGGGVDWGTVRNTWQIASDTVDRQITNLQDALRKTGDDTLEEIAEFGLNGLTGDHKVKLQAAMMQLGKGDGNTQAKLAAATLALVRSFRAHLDSDERVLVCDENPFGVQVSLRATLGGALAQIETELQKAA
jgi:hypothetical protein